MTPSRFLPRLPDFAALARRISAWTTNGLLTLMVLAAGVGFGRQVLQWWAADLYPTPMIPVTALPPDPLGDSMHSYVQFGSRPWSLRRQIVMGDKDSAARRLQAVCREILQVIRPCDDPPSPDDAKSLAFLAGSTPVGQEPGRWQLYARQEAFPIAVGIVSQRVALWAAAIPTGPDRWTLWSCRPEHTSNVEGGVAGHIPLPPETHRTLSFVTTDGGGTVAFSGFDRRGDWKRFYNGWFSRNGWRPQQDWRTRDGAWNAEFASSDRRGSVYLRFSPDGHGGRDGFVMITPQEK